MNAIRRVHQQDPEAGVLESGGVTEVRTRYSRLIWRLATQLSDGSSWRGGESGYFSPHEEDYRTGVSRTCAFV